MKRLIASGDIHAHYPTALADRIDDLHQAVPYRATPGDHLGLCLRQQDPVNAMMEIQTGR